MGQVNFILLAFPGASLLSESTLLPRAQRGEPSAGIQIWVVTQGTDPHDLN